MIGYPIASTEKESEDFTAIDPNAGWGPVGTGDFNGDGILDVLLTVNNATGGTARPSDFKVVVNGPDAWPNSFFGNSTGTTVDLDSGAKYQLTVTAIPNYKESRTGNCTGPFSHDVTSTCTITETYTQPAPPPPQGGYSSVQIWNCDDYHRTVKLWLFDPTVGWKSYGSIMDQWQAAVRLTVFTSRTDSAISIGSCL